MVLRCARIFPLYWLILTAYYLDPKFGKMDFSFFTYSLLHGFFNSLNLDGIAQAWSLSVEFTFYLLLPFLCVLERKKWIYLLMFLIGFFLLFWGMGWAWHELHGTPKGFLYPLKFVVGSTFAGRSCEFLAGMLLAKILRDTSNKYNALWKLRYKTGIGFLGLFAVTYAIGWFQPDMFHHGTDHPVGLILHTFVLPLFIVLALAGLISENTYLQRFFASRVMVLLGNASFAFYLIHISYVNIRLRWFYLMPDRNFVLLWLISIALYLLFEKPIYSAIRKRISSK
jgi:peptidoglycan/LPS O-acetylase OafA/YrhL